MTIFFQFDEISNMRILVPKNAYWKGAKKHEVKKVIKSKNGISKSCPKFCKLDDNFFSGKKSNQIKNYFNKSSPKFFSILTKSKRYGFHSQTMFFRYCAKYT